MNKMELQQKLLSIKNLIKAFNKNDTITNTWVEYTLIGIIINLENKIMELEDKTEVTTA